MSLTLNCVTSWLKNSFITSRPSLPVPCLYLCLVNANYQKHNWAKTILENLRWNKLVQQLWSYSVCKNLGAQQECLDRPDRPITIPSHIYGPSWCHITWDKSESVHRFWRYSISQNLGVWRNAQMGQYINDHAVAHLWAKWVPLNLRWSPAVVEL